MSHIETIMQQLEQALLDHTPAGPRISRSLERGYSYDDFPVIVLHQHSDLPAEGSPVGLAYRQLQIELEILAEGDIPHAACDPVLTAAHQALQTLATSLPGCHSMALDSVQWEFDDDNPALGICRAQYRIHYRRPEAAL
jgi:hypothetical protein